MQPNSLGPQGQARNPPPTRRGEEILEELLAGNRRFVAGKTEDPRREPAHFATLAGGQHPKAVIVGCADSRVAPELLFDQGIGDLFVVRVAGNVVRGAGPVIVGSIEYAVLELAVPLVIVLGHQGCGAVKAALAASQGQAPLPGAIADLASAIKPAVALSKGGASDPLGAAVEANVRMGVECLLGLEPIVAAAVKQGRLKVAGAVYDLRNGEVIRIV